MANSDSTTRRGAIYNSNPITDDMLRELVQMPPPQTVEKSVPQFKGLRFKHQAGTGTITFTWQYRIGGKQRKKTLGTFAKGMRLEDVADELDTAKLHGGLLGGGGLSTQVFQLESRGGMRCNVSRPGGLKELMPVALGYHLRQRFCQPFGLGDLR